LLLLWQDAETAVEAGIERIAEFISAQVGSPVFIAVVFSLRHKFDGTMKNHAAQ
jgi:hypothetical protein